MKSVSPTSSPPCKRPRPRTTPTMDHRRRPSHPRKLTIRPYRSKPLPAPQTFSQDWANYLLPAVNAIHNSTPVPHSFEELYQKVYAACLHKHSSDMFSSLRQVCDRHIHNQVAGLTTAMLSVDSFLHAVNHVWHRHIVCMTRIGAIFLYLDRTFVVKGGDPTSRSIFDMALLLFRNHFSSIADVQDRTVSSLLNLIDRERDGETIDTKYFKTPLHMLTAISTYEQAFEKPFLAATDIYYRAEAERLVQDLDVPAYLVHAEKRMREEQNRAFNHLDHRTKKPLMAIVEKRIVSDHVLTILEKGFNQMCDYDRNDDLKRCFAVLSRANEHMPSHSESAHELMKFRLIEYVKRVGRAIVMDKQKDAEMVHNLLHLKAKLDHVVTYSFDATEAFFNAVNLAFESFVNARENKPAELIAKFVDGILRTGNRSFSEEELENTLDKALMLFRFIDGKDVFEAFYKKDLSKRLLYEKSASLDLEKSMISKLKTECGSRFTSKLEAMFRDVDASRDLMQSFKSHPPSTSRLKAGIDLNVSVLEAARWPLSSQRKEIKLPQILIDYQLTFKNFYMTKHSRRKLTWQYVDGACLVKSYFPKGTKHLILSLYQTVVMLLFNDADELPFKSIKEATGIEDADLKHTLLSLACGKIRVLQKRPKGPRVDESDMFVYNKSFAHKLTRIKVNLIQMKETVEENAATTEKVFQERTYQIDAALVRILKTRRTLHHTALISEIYRQLRFPHKPGDIKKRIESLIDREYLERDKNNPQTYHYLA